MSVVTEKASALLPVYRSLDLQIASGHGCYLVTEDGRELLDFTSGIGVNAFGYADTQLADAVRARGQRARPTSNLFHTVGQDLAALSGRAFVADRVFFCNSGGEATEGALSSRGVRARAGRRSEARDYRAQGIVPGRPSAVWRSPTVRVSATIRARDAAVTFITPGDHRRVNSAVSAERYGGHHRGAGAGRGGSTP